MEDEPAGEKVEGAESAMRERDLEVVVAHGGSNPATPVKKLNPMLELNVEGIIVLFS